MVTVTQLVSQPNYSNKLPSHCEPSHLSRPESQVDHSDKVSHSLKPSCPLGFTISKLACQSSAWTSILQAGHTAIHQKKSPDIQVDRYLLVTSRQLCRSTALTLWVDISHPQGFSAALPQTIVSCQTSLLKKKRTKKWLAHGSESLFKVIWFQFFVFVSSCWGWHPNTCALHFSYKPNVIEVLFWCFTWLL